MNREESIHFRDEFREARALALQDAEHFDGLLFSVERLGRYLCGKRGDLGKFAAPLAELASCSPLAHSIPARLREFHTPFDVLFKQFRIGRNAALHEGAFARHLTADAVNIAIVLEDALMAGFDQVGDYMVRGVVSARPWQPLSFVRQTLLAHSFSFLPLNWKDEGEPDWRLVSDFNLAACLRAVTGKERETLLAIPLREAIESGRLALATPFVCRPETPVSEAVEKCQGQPIVVAANGILLGIATPFDLL